jgi:hypothetical protein
MIIYHYSQLSSHLQNCGSIFQWSISYVPYKNVHDGWSEFAKINMLPHNMQKRLALYPFLPISLASLLIPSPTQIHNKNHNMSI